MSACLSAESLPAKTNNKEAILQEDQRLRFSTKGCLYIVSATYCIIVHIVWVVVVSIVGLHHLRCSLTSCVALTTYKHLRTLSSERINALVLKGLDTRPWQQKHGAHHGVGGGREAL
jgi:hypothetical protein